MPLPDSGAREALHARRIDMQGYRLPDGRFEIEAHLVDTKSHDTQGPGGWSRAAGHPIHDMWVRLVVDEDLTVLDIVAVTDTTPYPACPSATATLQRLRGLKIGGGWQRAVRERLGDAWLGCTHLTELLVPLATAAYQTLAPVRWQRPLPQDAAGRPRVIDSCKAYAAEGDVVRQRWPEHHLPQTRQR